MREACYLDAPSIPLAVRPAGFALQDKGGAKGIQKLGYVSTTAHSVLTIGPSSWSKRERAAGQGGSTGLAFAGQLGIYAQRAHRRT